MRCFATVLLLGVIGCGKPPLQPVAEPTPEVVPPPALSTTSDVEKLEKALGPLEWYVNDLDEDAKPRLVQAPIVRSRWEKKTEEDFAKLAKVLAETGVPVIIDLGYQGTPATASWVKHLAGNKMVVGFRAASSLDAKKAIPELAQMPWLESLVLWGELLTDADFAPLAALTNLKSLELLGFKTSLTRASYATLARMTELRRFSLGLDRNASAMRATDEDLAIFAGLTKLESLILEVSSSRTTDAGLARLKPLTCLRSLSIESGNSQLAGPRTTGAFDAIGGMTDLEELKLNILAPSEGYAKLASLKKLRKLTVQTRNYLGGEPLTNTMRQIGTLKSLEEINLDFETDQWTDEALSQIKGLTNLRNLDLGGSKVTDEGLKHLSEMKELVRLGCRANAVTGPGLKHLAGCTKLEFLSLNQGKITDDGLVHLPALPNLRWLDLVRTNVTDVGLKHLVKLPKLAVLDLMETKITDACVPTLKQMPSLHGIYAKKTKLTPAAAAELKASGKIRWIELGE